MNCSSNIHINSSSTIYSYTTFSSSLYLHFHPPLCPLSYTDFLLRSHTPNTRSHSYIFALHLHTVHSILLHAVHYSSFSRNGCRVSIHLLRSKTIRGTHRSLNQNYVFCMLHVNKGRKKKKKIKFSRREIN